MSFCGDVAGWHLFIMLMFVAKNLSEKTLWELENKEVYLGFLGLAVQFEQVY